MKTTTQQPLKRKLTDPIDNSGNFLRYKWVKPEFEYKNYNNNTNDNNNNNNDSKNYYNGNRTTRSLYQTVFMLNSIEHETYHAH